MLQCLYSLRGSLSVFFRFFFFRKDTLHLRRINTREEMKVSLGQIKAILLCGWMKQIPS